MSSAPEITLEEEWEHYQLGGYRLATTTEFGPRITGLWAGRTNNLFAVLDGDVRIRNAKLGDYLFHGGHRLWVAPENPEITHVPDDFACRVTSQHDVLRIAGAVDRAGFSKTIEIKPKIDHLVVEHVLGLVDRDPIDASPWAITQLPPGGTAILPLTPDGQTADGYTADRTLVLWPYTNLDDPRIEWRDHAVLIHAGSGPRLKIGAGPEARKLGYLRKGMLFTKWFENSTPTTHADRGATAQIFASRNFCELETLGPMETLQSGSTLTHTEFWKVGQCATIEEALENLTAEDP